MRGKHLGRALGVLGLVGAALVAGAGSASAGQPHWSMNVENLPPLVAAGSNAGFQVTITNAGPSNISRLFLGTDTRVAADYVTTTQGTCTAPGKALSCSFGALRKGMSVTIVAAFPTGEDATAFAAGFFATTSGATGSDKGHASHGDTLRDPNETATELTDSPDFAGGFSIDGLPVRTDDKLSDSNIQSTTVDPPSGGMVTTAQDGLPDDAFHCTGCLGTLFGEWSSVNVDNGNVVDGLIKVTLLVRGDQIPYYDTVDDISVVHILDDGTTQILDERCGEEPAANCIEVTALYSGDFEITAYVTHNGVFKGMG